MQSRQMAKHVLDMASIAGHNGYRKFEIAVYGLRRWDYGAFHILIIIGCVSAVERVVGFQGLNRKHDILCNKRMYNCCQQ